MQKNKANSRFTLQNHQNHAEKQSKLKLDIAKSSKSCRKTKQIQYLHCKIIKIMQKNKANSRLTLQNHQNHAEKQSKFKIDIAKSSSPDPHQILSEFSILATFKVV